MVLTRNPDGNPDREQDAEIRENGLPGGRDRGQVEQVRLPETQQQAGDRQHGNRQHQRPSELLQAGEQPAHGISPAFALARSARTAGASAASTARAASARHSASVRRRTASLIAGMAPGAAEVLQRPVRRAAALPPARTPAPAHRYRATRRAGGCADVPDQVQHRGMQCVEPLRQKRVRAVDRQHVLAQVIGADREEIRMRSQPRRVHRRGRRLDHDADLDVGVPAGTRRDLAHQRAHGLDFPRLVHHRQQDPAAASGSHGQDGRELRAQDVRPPQAGADAAQAQRGIVLPRHRQERDRLVAAGVERPHHDRAAGHRVRDRLVLRELFRRVGRRAALEKQELGAQQSDTLGTGRHRGAGLRRRADVRPDGDSLAVRSTTVESRFIPEARALALAVGDAQGQLRKLRRAGGNPDVTALRIHDDGRTVGHGRAATGRRRRASAGRARRQGSRHAR